MLSGLSRQPLFLAQAQRSIWGRVEFLGVCAAEERYAERAVSAPMFLAQGQRSIWGEARGHFLAVAR